MMSRRLYFSVLFVLLVSFTSAGYGFTTHPDAFIKVDFDHADDVNTQPTWTSFVLADTGSEVNDVTGNPSGVIIDIGGSAASARRGDPNSNNDIVEGGVGIAKEQVYRDFFYGLSDNPLEVTLWGLGAERKCKIYIYAYDNDSTSRRVANWTANGEELLTTDFEGGNPDEWPIDPNDPLYFLFPDAKYYDFNGIAYADDLGRIYLTCTEGLDNEDTPFAFANGLVIVTYGDANAVYKAQHPVPLDGADDAPVDAVLQWKAGDYADTHDVYLGTNQADVTDANRSSPLGVLASEDHPTTSYDPAGLLDFNTTYYWRIDEVNDLNIWKGEVWSFTTSSYLVMDDFDSYEDDTALRSVWAANGTGADVSIESAIVQDCKSMSYSYQNNLPPYYSEVCADIADLGIDEPDLLGTGAEVLVLYFYGEPTNPLGEQMYVTLKDGDCPAGSGTVMYDNMNDARLKQWNKWSISLAEFNDVNLANVASITIGFGDGGAGTVCFEDITLDTEEEVLTEVAAEVDVNTVYQQLEGFGAAGGWHEWQIPLMSEPERETFYDIAFGELGLDIYRLRNTYDQTADGGAGYIDNSADIVAAAKLRNPSLKIMISSWSPPAYLKSNNQLPGGTLKKDPNDGEYMYDEFAEWWADSLEDWNDHGVVADYINIQNEPEIETSYSSCVLLPSETINYAGYDTAFEAVWQELNTRMGPDMPKMLVSDCVGLNSADDYIDDIDNLSHVYGYAHHLYNGGGSYNDPDGYISSMISFRNNYDDKPRMQTEFAKLPDNGDVTTFIEAMNLAHLMHNALVFEDVSSYCYWELFWTSPKGLISLANTINPVYYAFKHYAAFTDPGWYRVEASTDLGPIGDVRISAFKSPDETELTIVVINLANSDKNLIIDVNGFSPASSEIYRTSETENTAYIGPFDENGSLMLPARSITTIHSPALSNCAGILSAGYGLTSDIQPDCYVNYTDLWIITEYWLNDDCGLYGDCAGADFEPVDGTVDLFDLSKFAEQWMWCNNPEDPNCTENW